MPKLDTMSDIHDEANKLQDYFKSQNLAPGDAMMIVAWFSALMVIDNVDCGDLKDYTTKLQLQTETIKTFIDHINTHGEVVNARPN